MFWEEMSFEEFQDGRHGGHLGYWNGTILAILNLYVTVMPPIKFQLNPTYDLGGDVVCRISRWPPWPPSWITQRNNLAILNLYVATMPPIDSICLMVWEEMSFEEFQDRCRGGHLGYRNETILAV